MAKKTKAQREAAEAQAKLDRERRIKLTDLLNNVVILNTFGARRAIPANPSWGVVGVQGSRDPSLSVGESYITGPQLQLEFDDLVTSTRASRVYGYIPCTMEHVDAVREFADVLAKDPPPGLILYCDNGASLSTAVAAGLIRTILGEKSEARAFEMVTEAVKRGVDRGWRFNMRITPNQLAVGLFDLRLVCNGALVQSMIDRHYARMPITTQRVLNNSMLQSKL